MLNLLVFLVVLFSSLIEAGLIPRELERSAFLLDLGASPKPCSGHVIMIFESFTYLTNEEFENQVRFFGQRLFTPDYFNNYGRLSIATREFDDLEIVANFSSIRSLKDVKRAMQYVEHYGNQYESASLEGALIDFAGQNYRSNPNDDQLTAIFFVSGTDNMEVKFLRARVKDITDQGIRVVLIANGDKADTNILQQLTSDPKTVFKYDVTKREPDDYQNWFNKVINC